LFVGLILGDIGIFGMIPAAGSHAEGLWSSFSKAPQLEDSCEHVGIHGKWYRSTMRR